MTFPVLPNRISYAFTASHAAWLLVLVSFVYIVAQFANFVLPPRIAIENLPLTGAVVSGPTVELRGKVRGAVQVRVNGNVVRIGDGGAFRADVPLLRGFNIVEIAAKNRLGRITALTREIVFEPNYIIN